MYRLKNKLSANKWFWLGMAALIAILNFSPVLALSLGLVAALSIGNGQRHMTERYAGILLQITVVLLGFSADIVEVIRIGRDSLLLTFTSITAVIALGMLLAKFFKVEKMLAFLLSAGTAICGGSAIAALAPAIKSKPFQTGLALAVVFLLNGVGLIIFPSIGHWLNMDQVQFGKFCALAIHDTSSVVGASAAYGEQALQVGTTVKLTRALWIIPLCIVAARYFGGSKKLKVPLFLIGFLLAALLNSWLGSNPVWSHAFVTASFVGHCCLLGCLFFIGANLKLNDFALAGKGAFFMSLILWFIVTVAMALLIKTNVI